MVDFIGSKRVKATPMTRGAYNLYRGWDIPKNEDPDDEGYLVEYSDSNANHPKHSGYISWTPKKPFDDAYINSGTPILVDIDPLNDEGEPFVKRMVNEVRELALKIEDLSKFMISPTYDGLSDVEQSLLNKQLSFMTGYAIVLKDRIEFYRED